MDRIKGEIKLKASLLQDTTGAETYTLIVRAEDGGFPAQKSTQAATITIRVLRNQNTPQFSQLKYTAEIRQDLGFGNRVATVQATDNDIKVSS